MRRVVPINNVSDPVAGNHHRGSCTPLCSTCEARLKEIQTMAATTTTPPTTSPAAAVTRAAKAAAKAAAPPNPKKVVNFSLWKEAQSQAREIVGYKKTSPIYGKTETIVLAEIKDLIEDQISGAGAFTNPAQRALELIEEIQKRKLADEVAAKNYKTAVRASKA